MRRPIRTTVVGACVLAAFLSGTAATAAPAKHDSPRGGDLFVLSQSGVLSRHDATLRLLPKSSKRVTGVAKNDRLIGLDTRPATGGLYALSRSGQLYRIDAKTAAATAVGSPIALRGTAIGFDFNPTVDRIRLVTDTGQNLRLHPDTGAVAGTDTPLSYPSENRTPRVTASGYTNSVAGATSTALYGLDSARDTLVKQGSLPGETPVVSPNTGQLTTIGRLGLDISAVNGFDITGSASAGSYNPRDYKAVAAVRTHGLTLLVSVDLAAGRARVVSPLLTDIVGLTFAS
ncbi:hypothetical protein ALI144C_01855 [Actinosynnema sp. ALI-1.44]|uniref:DUF4394 domain-containing protein n=1 Tax=Actinosynnema sp. ALI-1.44 TaxID=1933779 RepID=UPI00097C22D8|nr:DUF4394 domain-containing protein [Actinosynnema sp. ALI-1.44]ONI90996.1 hypothetical protein ALI144C_01855 [Actinosynnema sp. ALI-1.44]